MSLAEPANVLQLLTPPDGFQFHAGVWLSHDLSWPVLCDVVAPALTGVVTTGSAESRKLGQQWRPTLLDWSCCTQPTGLLLAP